MTARQKTALVWLILLGHQALGGAARGSAQLGPAGRSQLPPQVMRCWCHWAPGRQSLSFMSRHVSERSAPPVIGHFERPGYLVPRASAIGCSIRPSEALPLAGVPKGPEGWELRQRGDFHSLRREDKPSKPHSGRRTGDADPYD